MAIYRVDDTRILDMWANDYRRAVKNGNSPNFGEPDHMVVVAPGHYGDTAILMAFCSQDDEKYLSPYFNQSGEVDGPDGTIVMESAEASSDPREWLDVMYGATDWEEWEWNETAPNQC